MPPTRDVANRAETQAAEILDAVNMLPPERREMLTSVLIQQETYSGPIPSPRVLAGMEAVVPGSASRVIAMAEKQQSHDHAFHDRALGSEISYRLFTLAGAVVVLLAMILGAVYLGAQDKTAAAVALGSVTGVSVLAGVLLRGRDLFAGSSQVSQIPEASRTQPDAAKSPAAKRRGSGRQGQSGRG